jgi:hypothetical protein
MEAPQVKNHRKPFREKSISNRGTTRSRGAGLFSWAVDAITRNVKPIPQELVLKHLREMGYPQVAKQVFVYIAENK